MLLVFLAERCGTAPLPHDSLLIYCWPDYFTAVVQQWKYTLSAMRKSRNGQARNIGVDEAGTQAVRQVITIRSGSDWGGGGGSREKVF